MMIYIAEDFTADEADILRRYSCLDQPVFRRQPARGRRGCVVRPVLAAALSLRRLFLKEFVGELDIEGDQSIDRRSVFVEPRNSMTVSSSSTATTRWLSSVVSTCRTGLQRAHQGA